MMDFNATSLYHSAMWDKKSVYPKLENLFVFKPDMIDVNVEILHIQTFNQDCKKICYIKNKILKST